MPTTSGTLTSSHRTTGPSGGSFKTRSSHSTSLGLVVGRRYHRRRYNRDHFEQTEDLRRTTAGLHRLDGALGVLPDPVRLVGDCAVQSDLHQLAESNRGRPVSAYDRDRDDL